jgi:hypothetical protein
MELFPRLHRLDSFLRETLAGGRQESGDVREINSLLVLELAALDEGPPPVLVVLWVINERVRLSLRRLYGGGGVLDGVQNGVTANRAVTRAVSIVEGSI